MAELEGKGLEAKEMEGKEIVLGITGSIAAYKGAEILRELVKRGAKVTCAFTQSAQHFVGELTFQTLSGRPVIKDLFEMGPASRIEHVALAEEVDLLLVAPATANLIGRFATGIADDFLSTFFLSVRCPVLIAPAMDNKMLAHPCYQANVNRLRMLGVHFVEPEYGELASGQVGKGRLADTCRIVEAAERILSRKRDLEGKTVLVSAGPTREYLDPIRFLSNSSSGRMGYALASAARGRGARVILVSGPTSLPPPFEVEMERITAAEEMRKAILSHLPEADIVIKAAAVADYRPARYSSAKVKKGPGRRSLILQKTPDILQEIGKRKGGRFLVGFAAETEDLIENAKRKLLQKNLDLIVANAINQPQGGFGEESNQVKIIDREGRVEEIPLLPKAEVAEIILDRIVRYLKGGPRRLGPEKKK
jgi:phosphopantothenoylcysteine decarboxylase/phosphopantothenate--cysteine ligase